MVIRLRLRPGPVGPDLDRMERWKEAKQKRDDAVWYVVVGVAMLFLAGFHWGVGVGGVLMVLYGAAHYFRHQKAARDAYDPWQDPELDAWEDEEFGRE